MEIGSAIISIKRMKNSKMIFRRILAIIFLIGVIIGGTTVCAFTSEKIPVLFLGSYNQGMVFSDQELLGVQDSLAHLGNRVDLHIEYMDSKWISDPTHIKNLYALYSHKYNTTNFSVIIVADDSAFEFVKKYRNEIFPGAPVVFSGINFYSDDMLDGVENFTGVVEDKDIRNTISTALVLFPHTQNIYVIHDQTDTGIATEKQIQATLPEFEKRARFIFISNVSVNELLDTVQILPPDSIILLEAFNRDRDGNIFTHEQIGDLVANATSTPMFGNTEMYIGHGIIGGKIPTGYQQGQIAGSMAEQILSGIPAGSIPVMKNSPNQYIFDYRKLVQFHIPESALPPGSIIANKPESPTVPIFIVYIAGIIIVFMAAFVVILVLTVHIRRKSEERIKKSEQKFHALFDQTFQYTGLLTLEGKVLEINKAARALCQETPEHIAGEFFWETPWWSHSEDLRSRVKEGIGKAAKGEFVRFEVSHIDTVGNIHYIDFSLKPVMDEHGNIILLIPEGRDITDRRKAELSLQQVTKKMKLLNRIVFTDIRNAVFSLAGYLELEKSLPCDPRMQGYLEKQTLIVQQIDNSLNFAKKYQDLGLQTPTWQNIKHTFLFAISHLNLAGISHLQEVKNLEVYADPLLESVFFALAENSITHGKKVTEIYLRYEIQENGLSIIFEDNGIGIPDSMKENIFERKSENKKGMGLFLTREILGISGITIRETGVYNKGARFEMHVPEGEYRFITRD
jgi:PAS domain S-box-containing protein